LVSTAAHFTPLSDQANTALDRIEIPHDAVEHISELLTTGSSLIISDYGISSETGPNTNFIVLTHWVSSSVMGANPCLDIDKAGSTAAIKPARFVPYFVAYCRNGEGRDHSLL
jgi:hypothetical protein